MNWILAGLGFMGFALAMSAAISDFTGADGCFPSGPKNLRYPDSSVTGGLRGWYVYCIACSV